MYLKFFKRWVDFIGSLIGIILFSGLYVIIAIAVKLTSKGPILFLQPRVGKNGKVFKIIKFRTMVVGAETIGEGIHVKEKDPRITKVGNLLRKTHLDEITQLFNVLIGDMSLVGPRPPVTYYPYPGIDKYPEWAKMRFEVRPGITGLAQVEVGNYVPWDERFLWDNKYISEISFFNDIIVILKTILSLLKGMDAYGDKPAVIKKLDIGNKEV